MSQQFGKENIAKFLGAEHTPELYWTMVFGEPKNKGFGGDGPTEQHESTTDTAGRFDKCNQFVEEGIIAPLEINHDRIRVRVAHIDTAN